METAEKVLVLVRDGVKMPYSVHISNTTYTHAAVTGVTRVQSRGGEAVHRSEILIALTRIVRGPD